MGKRIYLEPLKTAPGCSIHLYCLEISSFLSVPRFNIKWYTVPEVWFVTDVTLISWLGLFFFSFHPSRPTAQKIKMGKKWKKNSLRYHHFTHIYQKLWSDDVQFLRNGVQQTDRWTDGKSDIGVGAPPYNIPLAECIIEPLELCLSCNNSIFNKQHYLVGTVEGLKALPCTPAMFKLWVMYLL